MFTSTETSCRLAWKIVDDFGFFVGLVESRMENEQFREQVDFLWEYEDSNNSFDLEAPTRVALPRVRDQSALRSLWMCFKVSIESTVICGVLVGLYATFLWWLELNVRMYYLADWNTIPRRIHLTQLIADIIILMIVMFWPLSCIAPLCGWSTTKELNLVYYCVIGGLLDVTSHLLIYIFAHYAKTWKSFVGNGIFLVISFAISYRFARYLKTSRVVNSNAVVLAVELNLQFIFGVFVTIPFTHVFLEVYYFSLPLERTMLACSMIVVLAIPKCVIINIITDSHGICKPGDEIMLAVAFITGTTLCARLVQADVEDLSYFTVISVVHGALSVVDKLCLPLKRKMLSCICSKCGQNENRQRSSVNASLILANQTLISIVTEATSVMFCSAAAYTLLYYYERKEGTGERYYALSLLKEMVKRCGIGIGIELVFNVLALEILTYLYNIPVIAVWKSTRKRIIMIHMIQVLFIVLYFSIPINYILVKDYCMNANSICLGFFKRV